MNEFTHKHHEGGASIEAKLAEIARLGDDVRKISETVHEDMDHIGAQSRRIFDLIEELDDATRN